MSLWIPPAAKTDASKLVAQLEAESHAVGRIRHFNRAVKAIDPYCEIVKADETATHPALRPGYYHVLRRPPVGTPSIVVHEGPDGEFRELDSGILDTLRAGDMWNSERQRDREQMIRAAEKSKQREEEREREERLDEITDRLRARNNPGVLIGRDL